MTWNVRNEPTPSVSSRAAPFRNRCRNAVVTPGVYERVRVLLNTTPILVVEGRLQRVDGVTHVRAREFTRVDVPGTLPPGHDYW